jgi:hypothetical protein
MTSDDFYYFKEQAADRAYRIIKSFCLSANEVNYMKELLYDYGLWCFELGKNNDESRTARITETIS